MVRPEWQDAGPCRPRGGRGCRGGVRGRRGEHASRPRGGRAPVVSRPLSRSTRDGSTAVVTPPILENRSYIRGKWCKQRKQRDAKKKTDVENRIGRPRSARILDESRSQQVPCPLTRTREKKNGFVLRGRPALVGHWHEETQEAQACNENTGRGPAQQDPREIRPVEKDMRPPLDGWCSRRRVESQQNRAAAGVVCEVGLDLSRFVKRRWTSFSLAGVPVVGSGRR